MRVLYVNHTSQISGGERSLLTLLPSVEDDITPLVACPPGPLADALGASKVPWTPLAGTDGSLRLHPLHTPMALLAIARSAAQLRTAVRRHRPAVVDANSIRAGLVAALARLPVPILVRVRDTLPPGPATTAVLRIVVASARMVVANSAYTRDAVVDATGAKHVTVSHPPIDLAALETDRVERPTARAELGLGPTDLALGLVGQITPWKGQEEAIRATAILAGEGLPVRLVLAGATKFVSAATRFDNVAYRARLDALITECRLDDRVLWLGERENIGRVITGLDLLLVPSWEEPFGRTVVEGLALAVPVLVTAVGGPSEIVRDGIDGRVLAPRDPVRWAAAARELLLDPPRREEMGRSGRDRVAHAFRPARHRDEALAAYREITTIAP